MKILKIILGAIPLFFLSSIIFAPPVNPSTGSQLNPAQQIFFPKNPIDDVTLAELGGTPLATRSSKDTIKMNQEPFGFKVIGHTILNPIVFDIPNLNSATKMGGIQVKNDSNMYFFSSISIPNFDSSKIANKKELTESLGDFLTRMILSPSKMKDDISRSTIVIDKLITKDNTFSVMIKGKYIIYKDEKGKFYNYTINSNKLKASDSLGFTYKTVSSGFTNTLRDGQLKSLKEAAERDQMNYVSSLSQSKLEALNQIDRLKGAKLIRELNNEDSLTLFNAVKKYIESNNGSTLSPLFILDLSSKELSALYNAINKYKLTSSTIDFFPTLTMVKNEEIRRTLQEKLALLSEYDKKNDNGSGISVVDWYTTLSPNEQIMIKFDLYEALDDGTLFAKDPETLTESEREILKEYILETISLATLPTQIADLQKKLENITKKSEDATITKLKLEKALEERAAKIAQQEQEEFIADDILIDLALQAENIGGLSSFGELIIRSRLLSKALSQNPTNDTFNIAELIEYKEQLEEFLSLPKTDQDLIIKKAKEYGLIIQDSQIIITNINEFITNILDEVSAKFKNIGLEDQVTLLSTVSDNIYSEIFKTLSFKMQKDISTKLSQLEGAQDQLSVYQNYLLTERITAARTSEDINGIEEDIKAAELEISTTIQLDLTDAKEKFEIAENRRIAEHAPSIPNAGSTGGSITIDPLIINSETGQAETIHTEIDPTTGDATSTVIPAENIPTERYEKDSDLEKAREEEYQKEQDKIQKDKEIAEFNKENEAKGDTTREL